MTTNTKAYDHGINLQGLPLINAPTHAVSSLPATIYARIVYLTSDDTYYGYNVDLATWLPIGTGSSSGIVETIVEGDFITIDDTDPANPIVSVDDTALLNNTPLTGVPTAPTAGAGTNNTQLATTAYADAKVADAINDGTTTIAPSQNAVFDALALKAPLASPVFTGNPTAPTPGTSDNDTSVATTAMVQAAIDARIAALDVEVFKGAIDCSANPNYPAADAGHNYRVSVAGKIGGGSGPNVEVGDILLCLVDSSASGNHATVGANWSILQTNLDGAVTGPTSATTGRIATFNGTSGKVLQDGGVVVADLATVASPTFTGDPKAPTPSTSDNDTSIATTAFVQAAIGAKSYTATIGDGSTEDITITHSLGGRPAGVEFLTESTGEVRSVFWKYNNANSIIAYFPTGAPPATNAIRVMVTV